MLEVGGGGYADGCGGSPGWGLHERPEKRNEQALGAAGVLRSEGGAHYTGVHRIRGHRGAVQSSGQFVGEQHVGELDWS